MKIQIIFIILLLVTGCKNSSKFKTRNAENEVEKELKLSLAQWSFNKSLFDNKMTNESFIKKAAELGFEGVEFVSVFLKDHLTDTAYFEKLKSVASKNNIRLLLIMVDDEGDLGDTDPDQRNIAVNNHHKWVDLADVLGCHSIRVNASGVGTANEVSKAAIDGLKQLSTYAASKNINVLVENHGGYSSDGSWLSNVIEKTNMANCGTLPDFGNFCIKKSELQPYDCIEEYDKYKGVLELMPYAKAVSAKSYDFGELGFETTIDYYQMLRIVIDAGYSGYIGVEWEGQSLSEEDGVVTTKNLIENILTELKK